MKNNVRNWLVQLFGTKIGLLLVSVVLIVIFGFLGNKYEWAGTVMKIIWLYPIGLFIYMAAYAWVINPLNDYKNRKNRKK